ncbi:MAG: glycosyl transferase, partial [Acidimicrobiales bacterium]
LIALVAGLVACGRAERTDRTRAALVIWGGWLLVTGAIFSFSSGVIHTYYTVALAPAIAALFGIGAALLWRSRDRLAARFTGAFALVATGAWAYTLLDRTASYDPWLRTVVLGCSIVSAVVWAVVPVGLGLERLRAGAAGLGLVACLAGPLAYSATTITTVHTGGIPSAGPELAASLGGPGGGIGGPPGRGATTAGPGGAGIGSGSTRPGPAGTRPSSTGRPLGVPPGGSAPGGTGHGAGRSTGGPPGARIAGHRGAGGVTASSALVKALESDASSYRWVAATFGSESAATLELASGGAPVMAIGGFNGNGGNITLATFESYVAKGEVHYFLASAASGGPAGPGGPGGASHNSDAAITSWVASHFTAKTIGGQSVYDLSAPRA